MKGCVEVVVLKPPVALVEDGAVPDEAVQGRRIKNAMSMMDYPIREQSSRVRAWHFAGRDVEMRRNEVAGEVKGEVGVR